MKNSQPDAHSSFTKQCRLAGLPCESVELHGQETKKMFTYIGSAYRSGIKRVFAISIGLCLFLAASGQDLYKGLSEKDSIKIYPGGDFYEVKTYIDSPKSSKPKNIILMIGDGMGTSQIFAGITANGGHLFIDNFKHAGFSKTQSASNYITDSAAGGTALSSGYRTYNGAIGVDTDKIAKPTALEIASNSGLATGLVATASITHATPAAFIAHQSQRSLEEAIAEDFLKTDIDVFIGGGYKYFAERKDGRDLTADLQRKGYVIKRTMEEVEKVTSGKLAGLVASEHPGRAPERNGMLPKATETAINILANNKKGFFLMVEGSQIDWGGHANNTIFIVEEMLDFDMAVGKALEFAAKNRETLIVITADHETGGFSLVGGNMKTGMVKGAFTTGGHTAVMVPIFAFGPGADQFTGIMDNTDLANKLIKLVSK